MSDTSEYFDRIAGSVNLPLLASKTVAIVGIGSAGSTLARELANTGVGRLLLIDGKILATSHLPRHELSRRYVGQNKALGMAKYLRLNVPGIEVGALAQHIDGKMSDDELDGHLQEANLIIAATDNRTAQRRVALRALALDKPAILPALYANGGGEIFVQLRPGAPCFHCWDGFRPELGDLRAVTALGSEAWSVLQHTVQLIHEVLDPERPMPRLIAAERGQPPRQIFIQEPQAALIGRSWEREPNCPACAVGPSPLAPATPAGAVSPPERPSAGGWLSPRHGQVGSKLDTALVIGLTIIAVTLIAFIVGWRVGAATVVEPHGSEALKPMGILAITLCALGALAIVYLPEDGKKRNGGAWWVTLVFLASVTYAYGFGLTHHQDATTTSAARTAADRAPPRLAPHTSQPTPNSCLSSGRQELLLLRCQAPA